MGERKHSEEVILRYWRRAARHWPAGSPRMNVPVAPDWRYPPPVDELPATPPPLDYLTYEIERGTIDGRRVERVVCEGVVVAEYRSIE